LRILQFIDGLGSAGGLERFVYNFSVQLEQHGHETAIVCIEPTGDYNWGIHKFPKIYLGTDTSTWSASIERLRPDIVIWHVQPQMAYAATISSQKHLTVATVHGATCPSGSRLLRSNDEICNRKGGLGCLPIWYLRQCGFERSPIAAVRAISDHARVISALKQCTRIYAVSDSVKEFLSIEGINKDRVKVFDNTLGMLARLRKTQAMTLKPHVPLRLLYVGRLVYAKGVQYLIQAVKELINRGENVVCHIAGDGWYRGTLQKRVEELGLCDNVVFLGSVPGTDVGSIYDKADIVVVPSIWPDPAPLIVPEARERGKPVIAFDAGGLREWPAFMTGVYLATRADAKQLADVIMDVASVDNDIMEFVSQKNTNNMAGLSERISLIDDCELVLETLLHNKLQ